VGCSKQLIPAALQHFALEDKTMRELEPLLSIGGDSALTQIKVANPKQIVCTKGHLVIRHQGGQNPSFVC
jgi:hypothetical protein